MKGKLINDDTYKTKISEIFKPDFKYQQLKYQEAKMTHNKAAEEKSKNLAENAKKLIKKEKANILKLQSLGCQFSFEDIVIDN